MMNAIKAEFRKVISVRSTYFIIALSTAIIIFIAGFIEGFHNDPKALQSADLLASESRGAIVFVGIVFAFVALLLAAHEYRYNTITYTLANTTRRNKILAAKFIVITVFAVLTSLFVTFFSPLCTLIGVHLAGHTLAPQTFDTWQLVWRCVVCGWGYAMYAFILAIALRNQVGAIVTFLLVPLIGENILTLWVKGNSKYLPFTALQSVAAPTDLGNHTNSIFQLKVVLVYVVVGLIISAVLFNRRDAN